MDVILAFMNDGPNPLPAACATADLGAAQEDKPAACGQAAAMENKPDDTRVAYLDAATFYACQYADFVKQKSEQARRIYAKPSPCSARRRWEAVAEGNAPAPSAQPPAAHAPGNVAPASARWLTIQASYGAPSKAAPATPEARHNRWRTIQHASTPAPAGGQAARKKPNGSNRWTHIL